MPRILLLLGVVFVAVSFVLFIMSLLKFIPTIVGAALLFVSILFTVSLFNTRNQFRGFDQ
ncbi:hypothetical protein [Guptibacillus hwajinpoensis]|uniref:ABC-type multidrug transport system permease subunit n=1 Tax=Guptibacillus hwajinpoensis TaxID=208199 RepID=A0ABU0K234_9BACL|nr:hypothetical protein [Alkalihalobacillus hemicentroti]MDQ0483410.1 ABC-type multidrug transport system permease subunit [Alkalihalobacillus hemicentroti]